MRAVFPGIDRAAGSALDPLWPGWEDVVNAPAAYQESGDQWLQEDGTQVYQEG